VGGEPRIAATTIGPGNSFGKMLLREGFLFTGICPENEGWKTLIDFTARDNTEDSDSEY